MKYKVHNLWKLRILLFLDLLIVCKWTYKCRMWHTSLISSFFLSFFICKVFTAYNYFVLSQTEKKHLLLVDRVLFSDSGLNMFHWCLKTKWPVDRKSELFHKWKTCRLIKQTKTKQKEEENCCKKKKKENIPFLCSLLKCTLSFRLYTTYVLRFHYTSSPPHTHHHHHPKKNGVRGAASLFHRNAVLSIIFIYMKNLTVPSYYCV